MAEFWESGQYLLWSIDARCGDEREDLPAPHNNPIISLINDVMKANTVKIAVNSWIWVS